MSVGLDFILSFPNKDFWKTNLQNKQFKSDDRYYTDILSILKR